MRTTVAIGYSHPDRLNRSSQHGPASPPRARQVIGWIAWRPTRRTRRLPAGHGPARRHGRPRPSGASRRSRARGGGAGLLGPQAPVVGLLDIAGIRQSAAALRAAFADVTAPGTPVLHAFAVKAAPLVPVLRLLRRGGHRRGGRQPRRAGAGPRRGRARRHAPCWTPPPRPPPNCARRWRWASPSTPTTRRSWPASTPWSRPAPTGSPLGLRVNPQVGGGTIGAMSTATATSKFGVALRDEGAREWVRARVRSTGPWLTRLHTHTGSQGVPLELMAAGVAGRLRAGRARSTRRPAGSRSTPSTSAAACRSTSPPTRPPRPTPTTPACCAPTVPGLFDGRYGLVTEFGRSLLAKHGTVLARVEYAKSRRRPADRGHPRGRAGRHPHGLRARRLAAAGRRATTRRAAPRTAPVPRTSPGLLLRRRPAGRGPRAAAARAGATTWRCWTPARTTSRTTSPTTALPGQGFTGSWPGRRECGSRGCGMRRVWRRLWRRQVGGTGTRCFWADPAGACPLPFFPELLRRLSA